MWNFLLRALSSIMYALSVRNYTWYIDVLPILPPRHVNCYISSAQDIIFFAEGIMFYMFRLAILFHLVQYLENFILCFRLYSKKINFKHIAEFMIFSMFWKLSTISHDCIDFMYEETSQRILGLFLFCFLWVYFDPSNSLC